MTFGLSVTEFGRVRSCKLPYDKYDVIIYGRTIDRLD